MPFLEHFMTYNQIHVIFIKKKKTTKSGSRSTKPSHDSSSSSSSISIRVCRTADSLVGRVLESAGRGRLEKRREESVDFPVDKNCNRLALDRPFRIGTPPADLFPLPVGGAHARPTIMLFLSCIKENSRAPASRNLFAIGSRDARTAEALSAVRRGRGSIRHFQRPPNLASNFFSRRGGSRAGNMRYISVSGLFAVSKFLFLIFAQLHSFEICIYIYIYYCTILWNILLRVDCK